MAAEKNFDNSQLPVLLNLEVHGCNDCVSEVVVKASVSRGGQTRHQVLLNLLANKEWGGTKQYPKDSMGWVLLFNTALPSPRPHPRDHPSPAQQPKQHKQQP